MAPTAQVPPRITNALRAYGGHPVRELHEVQAQGVKDLRVRYDEQNTHNGLF